MNTNFKNSGIAWIGQIPKHWEVKKVKDGFYLKKDKALIENPVVLTLARSGIKVRDLENNDGQFAKSYFEYNPVDIDDILLNTMDLQSGANCNISKIKGVISPAYANLRYKNGFSPNFYNYYFKIQYWTFAFFTHGKGVSYENRWTLNNQTLMRFPLLVPPLNKKKEIAEFLDKKCEIIDKRLSNLERKIKSLKEYKKSLISECVTKGLNPKNMEFKDSGIPWIGQIPKHWEVTKIKYECFLKGRIGWQGLTTAEYIEEGAYLVTGVDFLNGNIDWQNCVRVSEWRFNQAPEIQIKNNDLLITKDGTVGKIALTKDTPKQATLNSGVMLIRPKNKNYYEKFLFYILSSDQFWLWFSYINSGNTTIIHLYQNSFDNFSFTLPPLNEQKEIAEFLDKKCEKIDRLNENHTKQITALKE